MRIKPENALVMIIDEQVKLLPTIYENEKILKNTEILIKGLRLLDVPFLITQQYTKGIGPSDPAIYESAGTEAYYEKRTFSCWDTQEIRDAIVSSGRRQIVLCGIESHICVMQTAIDLIANGYTVYLVEDCASSRRKNDKETALRRMTAEGVLLTTYESLLFELMVTSTHPNFREVSKLIK